MSFYYKDLRSLIFGIDSIMIDENLNNAKNLNDEIIDNKKEALNISSKEIAHDKIEDNTLNLDNNRNESIMEEPLKSKETEIIEEPEKLKEPVKSKESLKSMDHLASMENLNSVEQEINNENKNIEISEEKLESTESKNEDVQSLEEIISENNLELTSKNTDKSEKMEKLSELIKNCNKCGISSNIINKVIGNGSLDAEIFIIGESPSVSEDKLGVAFVGETGELLDKMLAAMGLNRDEVYLTNVLKCITPKDRDADREEVNNCLTYLRSQIQIVNPKVLLVFGSNALNFLFNPTYNKYHEKVDELSVAKLNGTYMEFYGYKVMPTYGLDYLIRNPGFKKDTWVALQTIMKDLGLKK